MRGARGRALFFIITALAASAFAIATIRREQATLQPRKPGERPSLLLVTSLPLLFGEGFSLKGATSPAFERLETRYRVTPISVTDSAELAKGRLLLMAHPLPQTAENLVALDDWVRGGGHLLLFADPMLEWPSKLPLGDPLRPPPMFMDTGLLAHWGLRLDAPDRRGPVERKLGDFEIVAVSPGRLVGGCEISPDALVARCRVGKGEATIVADADILNADQLGPKANHNLDGLLQELARLEQN